ncbi:BldC family transcriptional regulator [Nocardiopsis tropica]|uniref:BldC family transcriptional regulator n=1 Tax=Nocardiopsis tropica TaxID=109330 RepID=A0ABV1ZRP2_9ACTN
MVATAKGLLTPAEVARLFRVSARTVLAWSKAGRLGSVRTLGGHRRYREAEIQALFDAGPASSAKHVGNENTGWF